jgi:hypothetical protein
MFRREQVVKKQKRTIGAVQKLAPIMHRHYDAEKQGQIAIDIYVAQHCNTCAYAYEVAAEIRRQFPHVQVRMVEMETTTETIPEAVFATPTYVLNGRVWSLGNPSPAKVQETLATLGVA